ncbi:MAG: hypothetical protein SP1CHLAM54_05410 [Chlamydiia bacterium]|nr:hypothetical protein [Chlamydiia bacterium]MCH9615451.1 hypothetical protein [Chlamydiia bacterium]MCH9629106.1 hypothetical protein [Chlamydiia bacterium]
MIGAGYIGLTLLSQWQEPTFHTITTREEKLEQLADYNPTLLHINENTNLTKLLDNCDGLIVCAAPLKGATYKEAYLDIVTAIKNSLKSREQPLQIVYTSSTAAFNNPILKQTEDTYLSIENANTCILRLGGIYGPHRTLESRAAKIQAKGLSGTGDEHTNHIHRDDVISAIQFAFDHHLSGLYNLVCDDHPTRLNLYTAYCAYQNLPPPEIVDPTTPTHFTNIIISNDAIKDTGYTFIHPHLIHHPNPEI